MATIASWLIRPGRRTSIDHAQLHKDGPDFAADNVADLDGCDVLSEQFHRSDKTSFDVRTLLAALPTVTGYSPPGFDLDRPLAFLAAHGAGTAFASHFRHLNRGYEYADEIGLRKSNHRCARGTLLDGPIWQAPSWFPFLL